MKLSYFNSALVWLLYLNVTTAFSQSAMKVNDKTIAHLAQFRSDYSKSLMDNKPEALQRYYSDTVRLMPAFQKTMIGKQNAMLYFNAFSARFTISSHVRNEMEILDLGQQVMETGTFSTQLTAKKDNKAYQLNGKYLNLWRKQSNGDLLLITEAWNYDQYYGDLHEQLRFESVPSLHVALQPIVPITNSLRFELAALCRLLDATVTQHDAKTWSMFYADDGILMPGYHPACKGRKEIDEYIHKHAKELPVFQELEIRNDRIDDLGLFVVEYASNVVSWKNARGSGVTLGKNIVIWRRESDHSLKVFRAIAMYD